MDKIRIENAIRVLNEGGIIIFPTDTAYGIGCRLDNDRAIEKLFKIRRRPVNKAVPILVDSIEMIRKYVGKIDSDVLELAQNHWPGGLTIVFRCNKKTVPALARGGGETVGFRIPAHEQIREFIKQVGVPILAPSANFSGGKTPFSSSDLDPELIPLVDFVLKEDNRTNTLPSTVIDCSKKPWKILRNGAVNPIVNSLYIDTRDNHKIVVKVSSFGIVFEAHAQAATKQAQALLPLIEKVLKKAKLTPSDIQKISVEEGPGSFTGVRVGVAIANALSFATQATLNGKPLGELVSPIY